jgi:sugar lactone lactonase YvrE
VIRLRELGTLILIGMASACSSSSGSPGDGSGGGSGTAPLLDEYVLSDDMLVPESGTFDPTRRRFYVGSAAKGTITQVDPDGVESIFFAPPGSEMWRTLGMTVDDATRRLWVCAQRPDDDTQEIWVFDLESGQRDLALNLEVAEAGSTCNDIALDGGGLAYVSDSSNPRVYQVDAAAETVAVWANDPLLSPTGAGNFGGNGIAVTEDDGYLIVSKTNAGAPPRLLRIALDDPGNIDAIVTTPALDGFADGMSFLDGELYVAIVGTGNIARLTSEDEWATASIATAPAGSGTLVQGTSTVRPAEGRLYAIYSDITRALAGLEPEPPFRIFNVDIESFE